MSMQFDYDAKTRKVEEVPEAGDQRLPSSVAISVRKRKVVNQFGRKQPGPYEDLPSGERRCSETTSKQRSMRRQGSTNSAFTVADMTIWNREEGGQPDQSAVSQSSVVVIKSSTYSNEDIFSINHA